MKSCGEEKESRALALKSRGESYRSIGRTLKMSTSAALETVRRALAKLPVPTEDAARKLEITRSEKLYLTALRAAREHDGDPNSLRVCLEIAKHLAKLSGLADVQINAQFNTMVGGISPKATILDVLTDPKFTEYCETKETRQPAHLALDAIDGGAEGHEDHGPTNGDPTGSNGTNGTRVIDEC